MAYAFYQIAEIEKSHAERFGRYAQWAEQERLFSAEGEAYWMCLNCGHMVCGKKVPQLCPVCRHEKGYFIPAELAPYLECGFLK